MKWCGLFHSRAPDNGWYMIDLADKQYPAGYKTFQEYCEYWGGKEEYYIMVEVDDDDLAS